jgi:hypothetical protein
MNSFNQTEVSEVGSNFACSVMLSLSFIQRGFSRGNASVVEPNAAQGSGP